MSIADFFASLPTAPVVPLLTSHGVSLWVKRLDLSHPQLSGNKWYKLWYNLLAAEEQNYNQLLTFGGAYSNHIVATAKAGELFGFRTVGVIRGEAHEPLNPVLAYAKKCGMELTYLTRSAYRNKYQPELQARLKERFGAFYLIPEGGSNALALRGCRHILTPEEVEHFDHICLSMGTGGTLAGLSLVARAKQLIGFSSLKGGGFLRDEVNQLREQYGVRHELNWQLETDYHAGGFARRPPELLRFIRNMEAEYGLRLDPIYTGKLFWGILDKIERGHWASGTQLLAIHTGGLPLVT